MSGLLAVVERVHLLRSVDFFAGATGRVLASVAEQADEIELESGEVLIHEGEQGDSMFVVSSGRLAVDVGSRRVDVLGPESVVGEFAALVAEPRTATVTALDRTLVLRLRKAVLDELLLDHPEIAVGVIRALVSRFQRQLVRGADADPRVP